MSSLPCVVHRQHRPRVHETDVHHVWPLQFGGPNTSDNRVVVCASGHRNIHELLREFMHRKGVVSWEILRSYSPGERRLAKSGWDSMQHVTTR